MDTYCTLSSARFSKDPVPAKDSLESRLVNVIENKSFKSILSLAQTFTKAVYSSQEIGSLASEGEIKTFTGRYTVLKHIMKLWKLGKNIKASCSGNDLTERGSKNLTIESEYQ